MTEPTEPAPPIHAPLTGTTDIDWLRSTDVFRIERTAHKTEHRTRHTTVFGIKPGTLADQTADYSDQTFQPQFMRAEWTNGELAEVEVSGPLRLASSGLSEKVSRKRTWESWVRGDHPRGLPGLPESIKAALDAYSIAVSIAAKAQQS